MAENKPAAPVPAPVSAAPSQVQARVAEHKARLPRERTT